MCAKNHLLIFSSFLDIWENVEWPRFYWTTLYTSGFLASSLIAWCSTVLSCLSLFRPPGRLVPDGLMFYCGFFLSFFQCEISELPRSIALKLCHIIGSVFNFIIPVEKFGGPPPPKKWVGAKTCKIWVDFEQFSLERIEISKIGKTYDRQRFLSR